MTTKRWILLVVAVLGFLMAFVAARSLDADDADDARLTEAQVEDTVGDYLAAVHSGDYGRAAPFLVRAPAGRSGDERADLAPLGIDDVTVDSVADGLTRYCQPGCAAMTSLDRIEPDGEDSYKATVAFGEPRGHPLNRTLVVGLDSDGRRYVRGLPPAGEGQIPRSST